MARKKSKAVVPEEISIFDKLQIRTIVWKDHNSFDAWTNPEVYRPSAVIVTSIGYVVFEDEDIVSLANSYTQDDGFCCIINILKTCIVEDIKLK